MQDKLEDLRQILRKMDRALIAYSGGVDSTFLLKVAKETLKDKVLAVTNCSPIYPRAEIEEAGKIVRNFGIRYQIIEANELIIEDFLNNSPNRCYFCKRELFSRLKEIARKEAIDYILDGSNLDDDQDFRPGARAARRLGIRSPLKEARLTKQEIRELSRKMGLSTWNKPALACLATRIPYYERITPGKLHMIEEAEKYLHHLRIGQVRVRHYQNIARIEVSPEDIGRFIEPDLRSQLIKKFKEIGYIYVTLDLKGYRSGSMNEALADPNRK
jgi:uncharacterized protein